MLLTVVLVLSTMSYSVMHRILFFFSILNTCRSIVYGQAYSNGEYPSTTPLFGVTYSPFALNLDSICLPTETVQSDLQIIRNVADHVRLYNLAVCPEVTETILSFAESNGMRVVLCLFLSGDTVGNQNEINAVAPVLEEHSSVVDAIIVGNEVLFGNTVAFNDLLGYISQVKEIVSSASLNIPVSTSDVWPVYESSIGEALNNATDFICMNMQPFWEGWDVICPENTTYECTPAGEYIHRKAAGLEEFFGKPVWICEAGWPTEGERCCEGRQFARNGLLAGPSVANTSIVVQELVQGGRATGRPTYIHAIFDEDWKRIWSPCGTCEGLSTLLEDPSCNACEVDYHFGLYEFDRTLKEGMVIPQPPQ